MHRNNPQDSKARHRRLTTTRLSGSPSRNDPCHSRRAREHHPARFRTGLTRNQLLELTRRENDDTIKAPLQRLSGLTSDLQDAVMRARMQPVGRLFGGLPRLVHEVAAEVGKKIHLVTEGAETALERHLIDSSAIR